MNQTRSSRIRAVGCLVIIGCLAGGGCDLLIGIEELDTPEPPTGTTCETPADCPGTGNPCYLRACASQQCEVREVEPGFVVEEQVIGDCFTRVCRAEGEARDEVDTSDAPEDGDACTVGSCDAEGVPSQQPAEPGTSCDAGVCDGTGQCVECLVPADCNGGTICVGMVCVGANCDDEMLNGSETAIDCGGPECAKCADGKDCEQGSDCVSGVCTAGNKCAAPECNDQVHNGDETDVDCGGSCPLNCGVGKGCETGADCVSLSCECDATSCQCVAPTCTDDIQNGAEIDVDCGPGELCAGKCEDGRDCQSHSWCESLVCDETCQTPTCTDFVQNGLEEGQDCDDPATPAIDSGCPDCG